jgi:hypothetical protein
MEQAISGFVLAVDAASDRVDGLEPITSSAKYYSGKQIFLGDNQ